MVSPAYRLFAGLDESVSTSIGHALADAMSMQAGDFLDTDNRSDIQWGREILPHYYPLPSSPMHRWLAGESERMSQQRGVRSLCMGPRDFGKSVQAMTAVIRKAVENREPLIWLLGQTQADAETNLANIKAELEANAQLAKQYPGAAGKGFPWGANVIRLRNGVWIEAFSTGMAIRGRRRGEHRPTFIVADDLQSDKQTRNAMLSGEIREKDWAWFMGTLLNCGSEITNMLVLANALHSEAIAETLCRTPGWRHSVFASVLEWPKGLNGIWKQWEAIYYNVDDPEHKAKARAFYDKHREEMDDGAVVMWPERWPLINLMELRATIGVNQFTREKQTKAVNTESSEWPEEYFDGEEFWFNTWPGRNDLRLIACDPSKGKDSKRGDYSAFTLMQKCGGYLYVDCDMQRRPTDKIVSDGLLLIDQFKPHGFGIEGNQFQELLFDEFTRQMRLKQHHQPERWIMYNQTAKVVRIRSLTTYLAQKKLRFKANSTGAQLLVSQLRDFPDPHTHDDGPDSLEMGVRLGECMLNSQYQSEFGQVCRAA